MRDLQMAPHLLLAVLCAALQTLLPSGRTEGGFHRRIAAGRSADAERRKSGCVDGGTGRLKRTAGPGLMACARHGHKRDFLRGQNETARRG